MSLSISSIIGGLVIALGLPVAAGEGGDAVGTHRFLELSAPRGPQRAGFTLLTAAETGVSFANVVPESRSLTNHILLNGSGVAAGDVDGDGRADFFLAGLGGGSALYRNLGDWKFTNITRSAGIDLTDSDATGAVLADWDGDGDLDLLVSCLRKGVRAFRNDGAGHFQETTGEIGLASVTASMSMALADTTGSGRLDLYVANYRNETLRDGFRMKLRVANEGGRRVVTMVNNRALEGPDLAGWVTLDPQGNIQENGQVDVLYRNDGGGHFAPHSFTDGTFLDENGRPLTAPLYDWTLSAMFRDLNGDGSPDLYVCCDMDSPDRIWINTGDGHFRALRTTGIRKTSWFSMGVDAADLNRDGFDELFVTDMVSRDHRLRQVQVSGHKLLPSTVGGLTDRTQVPRNTLLLNRGDGDYSEIAFFSGLDASDWSWSPVFLDVDLDGYEDVLIAAGFERDVQDVDIANELEAARRSQGLSDEAALQLRAKFKRLDLPKLAFRNRGDLTFEEVGERWGFNTKGVSQGVALVDLDNDGDLDVVVNNMNAPVGIYRNDTPAPRLAVRLRGQAPNTRGIGARIEVTGGAVPRQSQEMQAGGRYLSSDDPMRVFAAGSATNLLAVEVRWRSGKRSRLEGVPANRCVEVVEPAGPGPERLPAVAARATQFEDRTEAVGHTHHDDAFDDFARQPLLPRRLSQLGPGVSFADLDGDGWEDLLVPGGAGGALGLFRNDGKGKFGPFLGKPALLANRDQTTVLVWEPEPAHPQILIGTANYEDGRAEGGAVLAYDFVKANVVEAVAGDTNSIGPLALTDMEGSGALTLFVGGRVIPGRYPEFASSRLFKRSGSGWAEDQTARELFKSVGLVSGATWSDLDGDGFPDLILACEWGPIRLFHNQSGKLSVWDAPVTVSNGSLPVPARLSQLKGWWNSVTAGDWDGDGRMDWVAGNWGRNHKYQAFRSGPLRIYFGDFNQTGGVDVLEAYEEPDRHQVVPWPHFGRVGPAMSFVMGRFETFRQFGEASVAQILGDRAAEAHEWQANWLETTLFLNRGDHWEARPLPAEAQWAPVFGLVAADFDNDGHEDLFLAQNFFDNEPETARDDAGRGLLLRGDGAGAFRPVPASESGVRIYGEQRGAAAADYDHDGRLDLVVAQNSGPVRLFRNANAAPGVRVNLQGPPGNPRALGAQLRWPERQVTREVRAGAGYWSQDGPAILLPPIAGEAQMEVRWAGGAVSKVTVPAGATHLTVKYPENAAKP